MLLTSFSVIATLRELRQRVKRLEKLPQRRREINASNDPWRVRLEADERAEGGNFEHTM